MSSFYHREIRRPPLRAARRSSVRTSRNADAARNRYSARTSDFSTRKRRERRRGVIGGARARQEQTEKSDSDSNICDPAVSSAVIVAATLANRSCCCFARQRVMIGISADRRHRFRVGELPRGRFMRTANPSASGAFERRDHRRRVREPVVLSRERAPSHVGDHRLTHLRRGGPERRDHRRRVREPVLLLLRETSGGAYSHVRGPPRTANVCAAVDAGFANRSCFRENARPPTWEITD